MATRFTQRVAFRVDLKTLEELEDYADRENMEISELMRLITRRALKYYRTKYEKELAENEQLS